MKFNTVALIIWVVILFSESSFVQSKKIPRTPCPGIFEYERFEGTHRGNILVKDIPLGTTVLEVTLYQKGTKPLKSAGQLSLDEDQFYDNVEYSDGIPYEVVFPQTNVVPRVTSIKLNGTEICPGRPYSRPSTKIVQRNTVVATIYDEVFPPTPEVLEEYKITYLFPDEDDDIIENRPSSESYGNSNNNLQPNYPTSQFYGYRTTSSNNVYGYVSPTTTTTTQPSAPQMSTFKSFNSGPNEEFAANPSNPFLNRAISNGLNDDLFGNPLEADQANGIQFKNFLSSTTPKPAKLTSLPPSNAASPTQSLTPPPPPPSSSDRATKEYIDSVCGQENAEGQSTSLNVLGEPIAKYRFPWIVAVYKKTPSNDEFRCGGSLISARTVITAAHCFYEGRQAMKPEDVMLSMGKHNLSDPTDAVNMDVESLILHPDFKSNFSTMDGDLAIVITKESVLFTLSIRPICLWEGNTNIRSIAGLVGSVVGWGGDGIKKTTTIPTLVNATIVRQIVCLRSDIEFLRLTSNRTLCAGNLDGSGPCTGDSGSGLMLKNRNKWMLRGSVTAGPGTAARPCMLNEYTIYADIAMFMDWIRSNMLF